MNNSLPFSMSKSQAQHMRELQQIVGAETLPVENNVSMVKRIPKSLGEKVKYYRNQRNLYQVELADIIGVSTGYIGAIEQGVRSPSLKLLKKVAKALKVSPKDLL